MLSLAALSAVLFWISFLIVIITCRRQTCPGQLPPHQTLVVKWGYLPFFLIVTNVQNLVVVFSRLGL